MARLIAAATVPCSVRKSFGREVATGSLAHEGVDICRGDGVRPDRGRTHDSRGASADRAAIVPARSRARSGVDDLALPVLAALGGKAQGDRRHDCTPRVRSTAGWRVRGYRWPRRIARFLCEASRCQASGTRRRAHGRCGSPLVTERSRDLAAGDGKRLGEGECAVEFARDPDARATPGGRCTGACRPHRAPSPECARSGKGAIHTSVHAGGMARASNLVRSSLSLTVAPEASR